MAKAEIAHTFMLIEGTDEVEWADWVRYAFGRLLCFECGRPTRSRHCSWHPVNGQFGGQSDG